MVSVGVISAVRVAELGRRRRTDRGPVVERWTLRWFVVAGGLMVVLGWVEHGWRGGGVRGWALALGWGLAIASFAVRWWTIAALGRFWSLHVEIRERHELVRGGPFRWVRHPTYFSMILELLAPAVLLRAPWALGVAGLVFVPVLVRRMRLEEEALVAKFGGAYREYQRTTPALVPWRRPAA